MLEEVRALLILQDRDRRLLALAKDLEKLPQDEVRAKGKLSANQAAVAKANEALVACELRLKRLELDTSTRKTTILRLKTQQFETRKNEEYQALGHEITRYEKEVDALETKELEAMEEIDSLKATHKTAQEALAKSTESVEKELTTLRERKKQVELEQKEVTTERDSLATKISESVLPLYQRLMKTKNGLAVAPMQDGKCGGCHMKLIASTVVAAQTGTQIARCEDCGRILYAE